jgi:formate-dependent nitrite reductase membrane component NrfD
MWSEQPRGAKLISSGHPNYANTSAAAVLAYDVAHSAPWDWRVSLYTWTKGIAGGVYLASLLLILLGIAAWDSVVWRWAAPVAGGAFLALTGALLVWELEHSERFLLIFTRPQWRSWLVRGAFVIAAYGALLLAHFLATLGGLTGVQRALAAPGAVLAGLTAVYTAYLFAQARARDLWQNPLLPPHFLVEAVLAGSALLLPIGAWVEPGTTAGLARLVAGSCGAHLLLVTGELTLTHGTAHSRLAAWEMVSGRYRAFFRWGVALVAVGLLAPWLGVPAALLALAGLLANEHAHVQAGQSVPLA